MLMSEKLGLNKAILWAVLVMLRYINRDRKFLLSSSVLDANIRRRWT